MAEVLKQLNKTRGNIRKRATNFEKYLNTLSEKFHTELKLTPVTLRELQQRTDNFECLFKEFDEIQTKIEDSSDNANIVDEREETESVFYKNIARAKQLIFDATPVNETRHDDQASVVSSHSQSSNAAATQAMSSTLQLPKINLPKFSGDLTRWLEYHDTFLSLIHSNPSLSNIQKFHYLRASLQGESSKIISAVELSAANYEVAWKLICSRYNNKSLLMHSHMKSIVNLPQMKRENANQLREITDGFSKHLKSLQAMDLSDEQLFHSFLIFTLTSKFDSKTSQEWEEFKYDFELPTLNEMHNFLTKRCVVLEALEQNNARSQPFSTTDYKYKQKSSCMVVNTAPNCFFCKKTHRIFNCEDFLKLSLDQRYKQVKRFKRCVNCLRYGHFPNQCTSSGCKECGAKHHTLLHNRQHQSKQENSAQSQQTDPEINQETSSSANSLFSSCNMAEQSSNAYVLLSTAIVNVIDADGNPHKCRVLLDSGSQSNIITERLYNILKLPRSQEIISVSGIGRNTSNVHYKCTVLVQSCHNAFETNMSCLIMSAICDSHPWHPVSLKGVNIPSSMSLADPTFMTPGNIDLLIGARHFFKLLSRGQVTLSGTNLISQKTKLGWIISGQVKCSSARKSTCNLLTTVDIQDQLQRFWEVETFEAPSSSILHPCEKHFATTTERDETGRFIVSIPINASLDTLGDSRELAKRRFFNLEKRLNSNKQLHDRYVEFISEYKRLGHMKQVDESAPVQYTYYIPHLGVLRESSSTTKLRVVFDASAKTTSGVSLNDIQEVGPMVQNDIFSILLRFRRHVFAVSADIEKMYRQILIKPDQRSLQRIIWRDSPYEELKVYELSTVTYGTASAPFLATRTLRETANLSATQDPLAAKAICEDFYVDDLLTGANSIEEIVSLCTRISSILSTAGFYLRKWTSNSPELLQHLSQSNSTDANYIVPSDAHTKTLGITWSWKTDDFAYSTSTFVMTENVTKRSVLSIMSQMFDPLGLVSPIIIQAKFIMQTLWLEKVDWDESLSDELNAKWRTFCEHITQIKELRVPRHVFVANYNNLQIHCFSDASERAYGACIYVRTTNGSLTAVHLMCSKTKVAPLKALTIPKLELCAAVLMSRLVNRVIRLLDIQIHNIILWTDSSIVLAWIRTPPMSLKTFVRNRVAELQESNHTWKHIRSKDNPADLLSRGTQPHMLQNCHLWWHGPTWLAEKEDRWPQSVSEPKPSSEFSEFHVQTLACQQTDRVINIDRFSSLTRLKRTLAFVLRFTSNCRTDRTKRLKGSLSAQELNKSFLHIITMVQNEQFHNEITLLKKGHPLNRKSKLLTLAPFLDKEGLLRVGGRIRHAELPYHKKHPLLLPKGHHLSLLIMTHEHTRLNHAGPELMLSSIRDSFWPISGRNLAKRVFRRCIRCFRAQPIPLSQMMGDIPKSRLIPSPPFSNVGLDYAGPILIKNKAGRGSKLEKCYVAIFICLVTKAMHIELVTSLTSDAFLATLKRFIARRGIPTDIYSDNATTFVGANRELKELYKFLKSNETNLMNSVTQNNVQWHFIPPRSPHFGGIWESGVKSVKLHLKRVTAGAHLTFEELYTTLTGIEAVLNSRPLTPLSSSPDDLEPLTPSHFLVGRKLTSLPEPNWENSSISRLTRYQHAQQCIQHFWRRWSREYVSGLQRRYKWTSDVPSAHVGQLALIKEDNLPPLSWHLGRIISVQPGADNRVRVVSLKTVRGVIKRAVTKICVLPME